MPKFTLVLMIVNAIINFIIEGRGIDVYTTGGISWSWVVEKGEYFRLISAMFLHADGSHLINNMVMLFILGNFLEDYLKPVRYIAFYMITGIMAGIASLVFYNYMNIPAVSLGASGAIYGILGASIIASIFDRELSRGTARENIFFIFILIADNIYRYYASNNIGRVIMNSNIDYGGHVGGFITGALLAFIFVKRKNKLNTRKKVVFDTTRF